MKISPFILIGGAGLGYLLFNRLNVLNNAANRLEWGNPKLKFGKATALQIPVDVTLDLINPTGDGITLDYFHGNIIYQGKAISSFTFDGNGKRLQIAPRRTTAITFTVLIQNKATITAIKNVLVSLLSGKKTDSTITIDGNLFAAGLNIPVAFKYDVAQGSMVAGIGSINTMGCFYFGSGNDINNLDDLRKTFYKLSKKWHPDAGGTTHDFQNLQKEYETLKYRIYQNNNFTKEEVDIEIEIDAVLNAIYQQIMNIPGLVIEVVGKWLWVSGNTYPVKDKIKAAGLKFASEKKMWFFAGSKHAGKGKPMNIDSIRNKYGSRVINSKQSFIAGNDNLVYLFERLKFLLTQKKA